MWHLLRWLLFALLLFLAPPPLLLSQTAKLREIHADGMRTLSETQVTSLSGLTLGAEVARADMQSAADTLLHSGLFTKVTYKFDTKNDAIQLTFHVEESPRYPVTFDNFPWYGDSELTEAIRKDLPLYDGTLPEGGAIVEFVSRSLTGFLAAHGAHADVRHSLVTNPLLDTSVLQFQVDGVTERIAGVEFSDPTLQGDLAVQQHLSEIRGKAYSRLAIDIFLSEAIRPIYQQRGFLRAKIGPAEVRLSGNPNQKLPEEIPVYVPCQPGAVYTWKGVIWKGNQNLSTEVLEAAMGLHPGDVADGMNIEGAWDRVQDAYGHLGYLEAKLDPVSTYDDQAHTVSYTVSVKEGQPYRFNGMTITGMSSAGERLIREAWPISAGGILDKKAFEQFLVRLELHRDSVFKGLPVHYDTVGHWLQTDPQKGTVDVLLDFK